MSKNRVINAKRLMRRHKIKEILKYWVNREKKWVQSCELAKEFVKGNKVPVYVMDPKKGKKIRQMPVYTYKSDSEFYRDLTDMWKAGILKHKEESKEKGKPNSYYKPSQKYRFEPLKMWYDSLIMDCSAHNIFPYGNSTLFSKNISKRDLTSKEKHYLKKSMTGPYISYNSINLLFRRIGLNKAGKIWKDKNKFIKVSLPTKFYLWLRLIAIHYLVTRGEAVRNEMYGIKEDLRVDLTIVEFMEGRNFEPPFYLPVYYEGKKIPNEWQEEFLKLLENAFFRYVSLKKSSFDRDKLEKEIKQSDKRFKELLADTLYERANAEILIMVNHPEQLPLFSKKEPNTIDGYRTSEIWEAATIVYEEKEKNEEPEGAISPLSFFDKNQFFKGLITDDLIDSGYFEDEVEEFRLRKEKEFYNELRILGNTFELPVI